MMRACKERNGSWRDGSVDRMPTTSMRTQTDLQYPHKKKSQALQLIGHTAQPNPYTPGSVRDCFKIKIEGFER